MILVQDSQGLQRTLPPWGMVLEDDIMLVWGSLSCQSFRRLRRRHLRPQVFVNVCFSVCWRYYFDVDVSKEEANQYDSKT
jgi:hypothetical protein